MISNAPRRVGIAAIITLLAATSDAFAGVPPAVGGTVVYGPLAESIPALSGTMLIVLGLLFSILTYRVLRTSSGGRPLASLVAMSIAGLAGVSGTNLIQDAKAFVGYSMSPAGGSIHVDGGSEYPIFNGTGRKQQIKSVTPDSSCMVGTPSSPACTPGGVVQPDASCNVRFDCNPA
jgi:hypothetical protein